MRCRHTVADWARYVRAPGEAAPIYAACGMLVKEGEPAEDPRTIACGYWGRQPDCPLYEGPGRPAPPAAAAAPSSPPRPEVPLTPQQMAAARLTADDYAWRGPLTDALRQRSRATTAALGLAGALALLIARLIR